VAPERQANRDPPPSKAVIVGTIDGLLLDIDGVLAVSWEPIPGAIDAMARLRERVPYRLITNTTTHTRRDLAATLQDAGFEVDPGEVVTAVTATASYLHEHHAGRRVFVLTDGEPREDLAGVPLAGSPDDADVIVIGGACEAFTYDVLNRIFRRLMDGAALVGMHRNLYWRTARGWELDGGAYIAGLEAATDATAVICGKPARAFFEAALALLGVPAARAAMVGDDITNDVEGARAAGLTGVLVKTGKFQEADLARGSPDVVLGSISDVPEWLGGL
jgi:HAD superfamily hydrolase (TIGR01458 family)